MITGGLDFDFTLGRLLKMTDSGGTKHDNGKLRLELVPVEAINAMARAFTYGANKYGDWNWSKGIAHTRLFGAALRHMWAYFRGEDYDDESGNHHLDHALASLAMLRASIDNRLGTDDRPSYCQVKKENPQIIIKAGSDITESSLGRAAMIASAVTRQETREELERIL